MGSMKSGPILNACTDDFPLSDAIMAVDIDVFPEPLPVPDMTIREISSLLVRYHLSDGIPGLRRYD